MSRGFPSMTALLGLLAIAGYQNRDKIAEMLRGSGQNKPGAEGQGGIGGVLAQLGLGGAKRIDLRVSTRTLIDGLDRTSTAAHGPDVPDGRS